jgi:murein L,D-transpeptidase YafK
MVTKLGLSRLLISILIMEKQLKIKSFSLNKIFSKRWLAFLMLFGITNQCFSEEKKIDLVKVFKAERRLELWSDKIRVYQFSIALGFEPIGHKQKEGDGKTPEGKYTLDYKNEKSGYFKAIHISYPNTTDREKAKQLGVLPGGDVMIHGQKNGFGWLGFLTQMRDWTYGCIALSNADMQMVWNLVSVGTPIEINP